VKFAFDNFEHGIIKRRVLVGQTEEDEDWRVGHPLVFPNILKIGGSRRYELQIRVPVDDTHTLHFWYQSIKPQEEIDFETQRRIPYFEMPIIGDGGKYYLETINGQDIMAWVTQGPIARRENERLGTTDAGLLQYRKMLLDQLARVEAGEDPMNVFRDPEADRVLELPQEENKLNAGLNPSATLFKSWRTKNDPEIAQIIEKMAAFA
jgi:5,5'-dehydrodivanillate O-demethylase